MKYTFSSLHKWSTTGSLVKQGRRISVAVCYLSPIAKTIPNFHFVCELLHFIKEGLFSDENTILTACAKTNAPVYSHGLTKGQMRYHVIGYYSHFAEPGIIES